MGRVSQHLQDILHLQVYLGTYELWSRFPAKQQPICNARQPFFLSFALLLRQTISHERYFCDKELLGKVVPTTRQRWQDE